MSPSVPIISTAEYDASVDILKLAGSTSVIEVNKMLGEFLARRTCADTSGAHIIGSFDDLLIAESTANGTSLEGKLLIETKIREKAEVSILGLWERGIFKTATPDIRINRNSVLVMAGSSDQLKRYDHLYGTTKPPAAPVLIIGGGRVGWATAEALKAKNIDYRILEKSQKRAHKLENCIVGDAAKLTDLKKAGIMNTHSVIITSNDDDINIYLTIYCRRLRPDIQLICRATKERNASTLQRAGADFVMSYASLGANVIFNLLKKSGILMVAEGFDIFKIELPEMFVGKTMGELRLRDKTGCTVIAVNEGDHMMINPDPHKPLERGTEIVLIGSVEAETLFFKHISDRV